MQYYLPPINHRENVFFTPHSLIHSLSHPVTRPLTHSLTHSLTTHSLTHSLTQFTSPVLCGVVLEVEDAVNTAAPAGRDDLHLFEVSGAVDAILMPTAVRKEMLRLK